MLVGTATGADLGGSTRRSRTGGGGGEGEPITRAGRDDDGDHARTSSGDPVALLAQHGEVLRFLHQLLKVSRADTVPLDLVMYIDLAGRSTPCLALSQGMPENRAWARPRCGSPGSERVAEAKSAGSSQLAVRMFKAAIEADAAGKSGGGEPVRNLDTSACGCARLREGTMTPGVGAAGAAVAASVLLSPAELGARCSRHRVGALAQPHDAGSRRVRRVQPGSRAGNVADDRAGGADEQARAAPDRAPICPSTSTPMRPSM